MTNEPSPRGDAFFFWMAWLLLATVIAGFGMRAALTPEMLPDFSPTLAAHAVFSAAWFLLLIAQTSLIRFGKVVSHRTLGAWSAVVVAGILVTAVLTMMTSYQRTGNLVIATFNINNLIGFSVLYALGVLSRRSPIQHKRYMLLAGVAILPPAAARLVVGLGLPEMATLLVLLAILLAIVVVDLRRYRRICLSTALGIVLTIGGAFATLVLAENPNWMAWMSRMLG